MKEILRLTLALGVVCCAASLVLAVANERTLEPRRRAQLRQKSQALRLVLPDFDNQPLEDVWTTEDGSGVRFYRARKQGKIVAVAGEGVSEHGFGGPVRVLVGMKPDGEILAVVVAEARETPGLGTLATDRKEMKTLADILHGKTSSGGDKHALPPSPYLDQYTGKRADKDAPFRVKQDGGAIDAVSGATISSRAVAEAVSIVADAFTRHRNDIFAESAK